MMYLYSILYLDFCFVVGIENINNVNFVVLVVSVCFLIVNEGNLLNFLLNFEDGINIVKGMFVKLLFLFV